MTRPSASQHLLAALAFGLCAVAGAQTAPSAAASDAGRARAPCESATFDTSKLVIKVPPGVQLPPQGVVVRVLLDVVDPNAEPAVTVTFNSGDQAFADAVVQVARGHRFNCAWNGSPLRYVQEVQFVGGETPKVVMGEVRPANPATAANAKCFKSADGTPRLALSPTSMLTGSNISRPTPAPGGPNLVIVEMTFAGPDVPPLASILFSRSDRRLEAVVLDYVAGHRWSCMKAGDPPVKAAQVFKYVEEGADPVPNKGTLQQFLVAVDRLPEHKVRFDFTTMGCPFKFRMSYMLPFTTNEVSEVGEPQSFRGDFFAWLRHVRFKPELNPDNKLVGRDFEVSVPCLVLDLL